MKYFCLPCQGSGPHSASSSRSSFHLPSLPLGRRRQKMTIPGMTAASQELDLQVKVPDPLQGQIKHQLSSNLPISQLSHFTGDPEIKISFHYRLIVHFYFHNCWRYCCLKISFKTNFESNYTAYRYDFSPLLPV